MKRKLNSIVLIDDDEATNFIHKIVIKKADVAEQIIAYQSAKEALSYLTSPLETGNYPQPDLILLDINMPVMNGWEFLEEYNKLSKEQQAKIVIIMLTTSENPHDKEKAMGYSIVNGFNNKPLTMDMLRNMYSQYFSDN